MSHRITGQRRVKLVPEDHRQSLKLTRLYRVFLCSVIGWWSDADSGRATSYCSGRSRTYGLIPSPRLISHSLRKFVIPLLLFARVSNIVSHCKGLTAGLTFLPLSTNGTASSLLASRSANQEFVISLEGHDSFLIQHRHGEANYLMPLRIWSFEFIAILALILPLVR